LADLLPDASGLDHQLPASDAPGAGASGAGMGAVIHFPASDAGSRRELRSG